MTYFFRPPPPPIFFPSCIPCVSSLRYRDKDLKDNYCRNPDNRLRPWCYTLDPKTPWEYCNITVCGKGLRTVYTPNLGLELCGQSLQKVNWRPNYCLTLICVSVASTLTTLEQHVSHSLEYFIRFKSGHSVKNPSVWFLTDCGWVLPASG